MGKKVIPVITNVVFGRFGGISLNMYVIVVITANKMDNVKHQLPVLTHFFF